jgi:hypothetical protein
VVEGVTALDRLGRRTTLYQAALARAAATGRPLVVVGDPDAGLHTRMVRAYGCGDLTIDLRGAPACPRQIAADLTRGPIAAVPDNSAVVYVSAVLEYIPDVAAAWREIGRMAGSVENLFVVTVEPWSGTATLYPGASWMIDVAPPEGQALIARRVSGLRKVAWASALGWLAWQAVRAPR